MLVWFLHRVATHRFILTNAIVFLTFAATYYMMDMEKHFINARNDPQTALYFSAVCQTTTGFGDIVPKTQQAKWLVMVQMLMAWVFVAVLATKSTYKF